ncbi:hypothetical protein [Stutzerimonas nitrititolerans]|uniref:hypothetical protein n=1 Tax=Stutzerimonas nitrititolerans TaxID=2482751 RepID=UPI00289C0301|nr:hypothetical protein [Stutzerimonas nitrititolerans]
MSLTLKQGSAAMVIGSQESLVGRSVRLVYLIGRWWLVKIGSRTFTVEMREFMPLDSRKPATQAV